MKYRTKVIKKLVLKALLASFGLFSFGFGLYLTMQANIGVGPWDVFTIGLAQTVGISYGTASIAIGLVLLVVDLALKEPIGFGMLLDAFIVGKTVDLFNWLDLIPSMSSLWAGLALMLPGLVIMGFSQYLYMAAALGCGPKDTLLIALKKRLRRIPIGLISVAELAIVTVAGWYLGGPLGLGTLVCAFCTGPIMQLAFRIVRFEPETVTHQDIPATLRMLFKRESE